MHSEKREITSRAYRRPTWTTIGIQALFTLLCSTILDMGLTMRIWGATFAAFWVGAAIILIRRPKAPTESDFAFLRFGFIPMFFFAMIVGPVVLEIRDRHDAELRRLPPQQVLPAQPRNESRL
jgi:hypothetical protein